MSQPAPAMDLERSRPTSLALPGRAGQPAHLLPRPQLLEELLEADDHPAAVQRANSLANYRRWYAGRLDPEGFGDKQAPLISISLGDMHLRALEAVKKLPPAVPVSPLPSGESDSNVEEADYEVVD